MKSVIATICVCCLFMVGCITTSEVAILKTPLDFSSIRASGTPSMVAYPFSIPEREDYLLHSLSVAVAGGRTAPDFYIMSFEGGQPSKTLVHLSLSRRTAYQYRFFDPDNDAPGTLAHYRPDEPLILNSGADYALVYHGPGGIVKNLDKVSMPSGIAEPLINETDHLWSKDGRSWRLIEGDSGPAERGPKAWALGRIAIDLRGVAQ